MMLGREYEDGGVYLINKIVSYFFWFKGGRAKLTELWRAETFWELLSIQYVPLTARVTGARRVLLRSDA